MHSIWLPKASLIFFCACHHILCSAHGPRRPFLKGTTVSKNVRTLHKIDMLCYVSNGWNGMLPPDSVSWERENMEPVFDRGVTVWADFRHEWWRAQKGGRLFWNELISRHHKVLTPRWKQGMFLFVYYQLNWLIELYCEAVQQHKKQNVTGLYYGVTRTRP